MDDLQRLIKEIKTDFSTKLISIESQFSQLEERMTSKINSNINEKFQELSNKYDNLQTQVLDQEKRIFALEKANKQRNLVFFGVEEGELTYFELQEKIIHIIKNQMKIDIQDFELESVRRLGKRGINIRPVAVAITTLGKKIKILQNKKQLKGSNIYVTEEYTERVLKIRKTLKAQLQQEIEKGNVAYIKYDKLIIKERKDVHPNKRPLSLSPPSPHQTTNLHIAPLNPEKDSRNSENIRINKKHRSSLNQMTSYYYKINNKESRNEHSTDI
ncbi:unnamed protein product [Parnassius apollo]|uniref:(apollo) hypothetical protein n=1 Tax=Parnassius apollo TaxID=110799 RepID=A0A8S3WPK9_PARAO|nr:unnamed protein product [Parnassius apollo]